MYQNLNLLKTSFAKNLIRLSAFKKRKVRVIYVKKSDFVIRYLQKQRHLSSERATLRLFLGFTK